MNRSVAAARLQLCLYSLENLVGRRHVVSPSLSPVLRRSSATSAKLEYISAPPPMQTFCTTTSIMAVARLQAAFASLSCCDAKPEADTYLEEKSALLGTSDVRSAAEVAEDVVSTITQTSMTGPALQMKLDSIVGTYGWSENVAKWVLDKLSQALQATHEKLGPAVRDAYHKAWKAANSTQGFVSEHPIMCTVIALGVLAVIAPWVLEALGFGELGPIAGTLLLFSVTAVQVTNNNMVWVLTYV